MTPAISSIIAPVSPSATTQPSATTSQPKTANGFAKLLSQRQAMAAHEPGHANKTAPAEKPAAKQEQAAPQNTAQATHKAPAHERQTAKADKPKSSAKPAAEKGDDAKAADKSAGKTEEGEPTDPALADWMSALNLPPAAQPAETAAVGGKRGSLLDAAGAEAAKGGQVTAKGLPGGNGTAANTRGTGAGDAAERIRAARDGLDPSGAVQSDAQAQSAWQAAVESVGRPEEAKPRTEVGATGAVGAAGALTPSAKAADVAAPAVVHVPTPATAAEFPKELGMQISVLAQDGVQQAELHLNPADMGPISVQISLDGTQAQVNFGADSAATRQIIEGGLPELAAAMRDAGFTLSGGGVHQQAQGRREGGEPSGGHGSSGRGGSAGEVDSPARRTTARVSAGGVDLYA